MISNAGYTAGDLQPMLIADEMAFGDTPSAGWEFGPELVTFQKTDNIEQYREWWGGSRQVNINTMVSQGLTAGFDMMYNERARTGWHRLVTGALSPDHSFSAIVDVGGNRRLYNGCSINEMALTASRPTAILSISAKVMARYVTPISSTGTISGLQNRTIAAPSARSTAPGVQWTGATLMDGVRVYPQDLTITITNNIERELGTMTGDDGLSYSGTVACRKGRGSINVEFNAFLKNFEGIDKQMSNAHIRSFVCTLGGATFSFTDGRYEVGNWEAFRNDQMSEKFKLTFASLEVTG